MDLAKLYNQLIRIDGLDVWEGLSHVGLNRRVYADALRLFCGELEQKTRAVSAALETENWKEYAQALHAVKGALAGVGAWELAQRTQEIEAAFRKGDYARSRAEMGVCVEALRKFSSALRSTLLFTREVEKPREEASIPYLKEKLEQLKTACSTGNSVDADALGKELAAKTFLDEETDKFVERIRAYIENFDYDLVLEAIAGSPFLC
ncbi:MAG: Hpt domain-containing protein [Treponema sp.]|jgi:HPt (histidine-containing phosphotransfer) domain-containing protein|nr:Hpt domain-containing protein [Treponema sp.]